MIPIWYMVANTFLVYIRLWRIYLLGMFPHMTLDSWLLAQRISEIEFGLKIGRTQASVNRYRRGLRIPDVGTMRKIVAVTQGAVTANDFYGLVQVAA